MAKVSLNVWKWGAKLTIWVASLCRLAIARKHNYAIFSSACKFVNSGKVMPQLSWHHQYVWNLVTFLAIPNSGASSHASVRILWIFGPFFQACFWPFLVVKKGNFCHRRSSWNFMKLILGDKVECFVLLCEVSWPSVIAAKCGPTFCTWPCMYEHPTYGRYWNDSAAWLPCWPAMPGNTLRVFSDCCTWHTALVKEDNEILLYWDIL